MKIPKIIHYCWFGNKPFPNSINRCMLSWRKFCSDFEIRCWDESNVYQYDSDFLKQALELGKWAFAADYIRLMALYDFGGIYLDTDVELIRSPLEFMENDIFLGFESCDKISTAVIGSSPENSFIKTLAEEYSTRSLLLPNGNIDYTPNVVYFTQELVKRGMKTDNSLQTIDSITIYPCEFFSPKNLETGRIHITDNTCAIHHFCASWLPLKKRINTHIAQIIGPKLTKLVKGMARRKNYE